MNNTNIERDRWRKRKRQRKRLRKKKKKRKKTCPQYFLFNEKQRSCSIIKQYITA